MKKSISFLIFIFCTCAFYAQNNTPKIVLITLDGLRWQELFSGADAELIANKDYVHDSVVLKEKFWRENGEDRRTVLFPFLWNEVSKMGQIYGNRTVNSNVNLTNGMRFSYPGYNEILSGKADDKRITSNSKTNNPNKTLLEIVNAVPKYKGKVAAFASWDVFPYIINEERSGVPVNAGFEKAKGASLTEKELFLNKLQDQIPSPWGSVRLDAFTHNFALEHMKKEHPELIYIAYGETDDFAHDGDYSAYLKSANTTDGMLKDLWNFTQNDSFYKDNTIFVITTDHGRGTDPIDTWRSHGKRIDGADEVWVIVFGNNVVVKGEVAVKDQLQSIDIAPTVLSLLEVAYDHNILKGEVIKVLKE